MPNGDLIPAVKKDASGKETQTRITPLSLTGTQDLSLKSDIDISIHFDRWYATFKTLLKGLEVAIDIKTEAGEAHAEAVVTSVPTVLIDGALEGVADTFLPGGTMESHMTEFFQGLKEGPDGKGSRVTADYTNTTQAGNSVLKLDGHEALIENWFARRMAELVTGDLQPNEEAIAELNQLWVQVINSVSDDFKSAFPELDKPTSKEDK